MTWLELLTLMQQLSHEQLNTKVVALIDAEPWTPEPGLPIAPADDPEYPNTPYLFFK